ncbi:unnamed protein product [Effrenium voratum]|nr:unnamed protein product [Effrenium voratum]
MPSLSRPWTKCSSWRRSRTGPKANLLNCRPGWRSFRHAKQCCSGKRKRSSICMSSLSRPLTKCSSWRRSRTGPKANLLSCRPGWRSFRHAKQCCSGKQKRSSICMSSLSRPLTELNSWRRSRTGRKALDRAQQLEEEQNRTQGECAQLQARLQELQTSQAVLQHSTENEQQLHAKLEQALQRAQQLEQEQSRAQAEFAQLQAQEEAKLKQQMQIEAQLQLQGQGQADSQLQGNDLLAMKLQDAEIQAAQAEAEKKELEEAFTLQMEQAQRSLSAKTIEAETLEPQRLRG